MLPAVAASSSEWIQVQTQRLPCLTGSRRPDRPASRTPPRAAPWGARTSGHDSGRANRAGRFLRIDSLLYTISVLSSAAACFSYLLIHAEYRRVAISSFGSRRVTQWSIVNCHIVSTSHAMRMEGRETAATRPILSGLDVTVDLRPPPDPE